MTDLSWLSEVGFAVKSSAGIYEIPFIDRMGIVFVFCIIGMVIISLMENKGAEDPKGLEIDATMFKTSTAFAVGALIVVGLIVALYSVFW